MRTIKFRGKDIETGEWVYGDLIQRMGFMPSILYPYEHDGKICYAECAVKRETVGQFTGLLDKNGKEIYEGDIYNYNNPNAIYCVGGRFADNENRPSDVKVIGNIHDNPELLKGGKE